MMSKKRPPKDWHLYVILDRDRVANDGRLFEIAEGAIRGGADAIQLRYKSACVRDLVHLAKRIKAICDRRNIPLIINDRPEAAIAVGADGVHLGMSDMDMRLARRLIGKDKVIGVSATKPRYIKWAVSTGADYIGFGPIFRTPIKRWKRPLGVESIMKTRSFDIPFVFIGGINLKNVKLLARQGARRIAVIRAVVKAPDPEKAARALREALT